MNIHFRHITGQDSSRTSGRHTRSRIWTTAGMSVLVGSWALISSSGNAGTQDYAKRFKTYECSNKTLRGTYGGQMQGTRPAPGGGLEQLIGVVIRTYDGAGNFTQVDNIKGSVAGIVPDRPGSGTYSVSADCSFTTQFQPGPGVLIEETGNIVDYGNEVQSITVTPQPLMVTGSAKRIGFR